MMTQAKEMRPDGKLRLPPGQHLTTGWPVLHYGSDPAHRPRDAGSSTSGASSRKRSSFTWETFNALGQSTDVNDIHCVTTWSKYDNAWQGVPFRALLDAIKLKPEAKYAMLHSYGGYTTNVPLADLMQDGVMFAHTHNGEATHARSTAGRCGSWSRTCTSGRARSGSAGSSSSIATARDSGRRTATTCTATPGAKSATANNSPITTPDSRNSAPKNSGPNSLSAAISLQRGLGACRSCGARHR